MKGALRIFLGIFSVLLILFISEVLYIFNSSNSTYKGFYYFEMAKMSAKKGNPQAAIDYLVKWADYNIRLGRTRSEELLACSVVQKYPSEIELKDNEKLKNDINKYFSNISFINLFPKKILHFASHIL